MKTSFWKFCIAVAIDWGSTFFLRKGVRKFPKLSRNGLLKFLNVFNISHSWKSGINWSCCLQSAGYELWCFFGGDLQTVRTSQISHQKWALLWWVTLATWNQGWCCCWTWRSCYCSPSVEGPKIWSASFKAGIFWLRNCGWLVEWDFFCFPGKIPGEQRGISSSFPITMYEICSRLTSSDSHVRKSVNLGAFINHSVVSSAWTSGCVRDAIRGKLGLVGSEATRLVVRRRLKCGFSLLNNSNSFFVTVPSIFSETWIT